jgi:benzaldehyde dehydrogenase (NAD)
MSFLKEETWNGQVYSGGWITPEGGDAAVIEPATGRELGRIGIATPADVTRAVRKAAAAPVIKFSTAEEAAELAAQTEYGLSLGILTRDVMRGLDLARKIPTGIVHINEQTVDDEPNVPFGGIFDSGTGTRFGGSANLDAFTETRWVTIRGDIAPYPF